MRGQIKNNLFLLLMISLMMSNSELIERDFSPAGRIDAMIDSQSDNLKLIQLDLKNDSLYNIADSIFPKLELLNGPASYHRIITEDQLSQLQTYLTDDIVSVLDSDYSMPDESRLYWLEVKPGNQTYGTYTEDEAIEYTCACIGDQTSDCVKLGYDESWYNPFDYYGEAWWGFIPPYYDYIQEIRVTVRGAQCDDLPIWSETYMGLKDDNGNWSNDYELSIYYADNIFIVPETWSQGMLMPTVGSEDNYVVDFVRFEFFYSCIDMEEVASLSASDQTDCSVVEVDWEYEASSSALGARLYRDGELLFETSDLNQTSFIDYSAEDNVNHEYCIQTFNECSSSDFVCNMGGLNSEPDSVSNVDAEDGDSFSQIIITWDEVDNAEGYRIYRDETWLSLVYSYQDLDYVDTFIEAGVVYNYCIESYNECGDSSWSCDTGFSGAYLGDSNFDGNIDVLDVVTLVNFILLVNEPTDDQSFWLDMNQDGLLNVQDIVLLVNIILN